jgi:hypothetical protein
MTLPIEEKRKPRQVRGRVWQIQAPGSSCSNRPVDRAGKILDRSAELASRHRFFQQSGEHYRANRRKVHARNGSFVTLY